MLVRIQKSYQGVSLIEVILSMAIFGLIAAAMVTLAVGGFTALGQGGEQTEAEALAQEGLEAVRAIRDGAWNELLYTTSSVSVVSSSWSFDGELTTETIGQYTRTISFEDVCRDSSGDITDCPGSYTDIHTKQATVSVLWEVRPGVTNEVQKITYFTNWDSRDWVQTDWVGGSGQSIWSDETMYDSDNGNIEYGVAGQVTLLEQAGSCGSKLWPFTASSSYTYDNTKIEIASGVAQLVSSPGSTVTGTTQNNDFVTDAASWSFTTWDAGGGEVTPTGDWQSIGGNPSGYIDVDIPSNAKNDEVGGFWEQSISVTENSATVTCSFDWSVVDWVAANGVDDYQVYVFLDSASGEPTIGNQVWSSGSQSGTSAWSGTQNIDCSSAASTAGTYYFKLAVWLDAKNKNTGPVTVGFDNALVYWEKSGGGSSYPADVPSIYPNNSHLVSSIDAWSGFNETATKNGGEIYYQLSDDNGSTWQYWNGSVWITAGASNYNTASIVLRLL
ncbi:hypothetical protein C0581_02575 [Candidatus Parcubacteria bacterium]|nr:MAG: hypothetical protein C0581_02575 [Candidatus Parcubacteria bacterium]